MDETNEITGIVFDIKELSVYDGPGIRTTVFLKGCPLRCAWCHNPEGLSASPQIWVNINSCRHCRRCETDLCAVISGSECTGCGKCVPLCPEGLRRIAGESFTAGLLERRLLRTADWFNSGTEKGGVTFSGGEPTLQYGFLREMLTRLRAKNINTAVQTCGWCDSGHFKDIISLCDLVFFDIKHTSEAEHIKYTGRSMSPIITNLGILKHSGIPFIARIPLIHGINDDIINIERTAGLLTGAENLIRAELLPYNTVAGAKYPLIGREFKPSYSEEPPVIHREPFEAAKITVRVL
jgi:pyruvate formate lyase activating enzyme